MKSLKLGLITLALLFSSSVMAQGEKTSTISKEEQNVLAAEKKSRKKKVEMCAECGKPESECECDHHKKEKK